MSHYIQKCVLLLAFMGLGFSMSGQSIKAYMAKAQSAYSARNYSSALAYYRTVLTEEPNRLDALYFAAQSARQMQSYKLAEGYFESIPDAERTGSFAETNYWLAEVKKSLEKFPEAVTLLQQYIDSSPIRDDMTERAFEQIENCNWAIQMMQRPLKIEIDALPQGINSYYSDYAPYMIGDTMYYTSTDEVKVYKSERAKKKARQKKHRNNERLYKMALVTKIFMHVDGEEVGSPIRQNTKEENAFTANLTFNFDKSRMYYTLCEQKPKQDNYRCDLYYRDRMNGSGWGRAQRLPEPINLAGFVTTQATIGKDANSGRELLFFVSDRPGGQGGMDIWYAVIEESGTFTAPVNLSAINTKEDDLTPFFETATQTLYFSSDGYQNFGGYDIFKTWKDTKGWSLPENLGYPINSSFDDIYYITDINTGRTLFSSNRPGSLCISADKDCNLHDIYEIGNQLELMVSIFNESDFSMVRGAAFTLINQLTGEKESFVMEPDKYNIPVALRPGQDYQLSASKDGFIANVVDINGKDLLNSTDLKKYIFLKPETRLMVRTYDGMSKAPLFGMSVKVTDLSNNKSQVYEIPANSFEASIPVKTDRAYKVVGVAAGFEAVAMEVDLAKTAGKQERIVQDLFFKPFLAGLPISIYFDNDQPSTKNDRSDYGYEQYFKEYLNRREEFLGQISKGLSGIDAELARYEANKFFNDEYQQGYYKLLQFADNLLYYLQRGDKVQLMLEGYTSPLADENYNETLAERRIQTVLEYFETYNGGVFKPFIGKELTFMTMPFGEKKVSSDVSDDGTNKIASVFSPSACMERRVVIAGFKLDVAPILNASKNK